MQVSDYTAFLERKRAVSPPAGKDCGDIHAALWPFEAAIVRWAVRRGRAAIFADCGMGKTIMQLEWARQIGGRSLLVAPLAVTHQTIDEARKIGLEVQYVTTPRDDVPYQITNYQRLERFVDAPYDSIVLDESSILKSLDGTTRGMLLRDFCGIPYRLCCTATPSPNDLTELGNHAEFLDIMSFKEMSASFFVKESNGQAWRLKGHAADAFYRWLASWSVYIRKPSDIGFDDEGFELPPLSIEALPVESDVVPAGRLFPGMDPGIRGRLSARRATQEARIDAAIEVVAASDGQWIVWHGLNEEGREFSREFGGDAVLVEGPMSDEAKTEAARAWLAGEVRVLVTKPSIFGFGMNFQQCSNVLFLGLGDSYEQYYQAIRRCWRFGQTRPVRVVIVTSEAEQDVVKNVQRKEEQATAIAREVVDRMSDYETREIAGATKDTETYSTDEESGQGWTLKLGDSTERLSEVESESVGLSVFSPPFVSLYTYTATERDMGNSRDEATFFEHFGYVIRGLLRVTLPGRQCCVHVAQIPAMLVRDGYIGLKDFRGRTIEQFESRGWIYHGEAVIDKDPQAQAIRTKSKGLLFVQLKKDSSWLRPALADYVLVFRKPGDNAEEIKSDLTNDEWIQWARPIWYGIRETDTLNYREARSDKDERHICPLQLGVIERCVRLWSNRGDLVLSPFAGIGSEGYVAVKHGRRFVGIELKPEYYRCGVQNLRAAEQEQHPLFAVES